MLLDFTIGRKGLLGYLKTIAGSNVVKVAEACTYLNTASLSCTGNTSLGNLSWGSNPPGVASDIAKNSSVLPYPHLGNITPIVQFSPNKRVPLSLLLSFRPFIGCPGRFGRVCFTRKPHHYIISITRRSAAQIELRRPSWNRCTDIQRDLPGLSASLTRFFSGATW